MSQERTYGNTNQQTLMSIVEYLAEDILTPKTNKDISQALNLTQDVVFRSAWNLKERGWAEETPAGLRLAPRIVRISDQFRLALRDAAAKYLGMEDK